MAILVIKRAKETLTFNFTPLSNLEGVSPLDEEIEVFVDNEKTGVTFQSCLDEKKGQFVIGARYSGIDMKRYAPESMHYTSSNRARRAILEWAIRAFFEDEDAIGQ